LFKRNRTRGREERRMKEAGEVTGGDWNDKYKYFFRRELEEEDLSLPPLLLLLLPLLVAAIRFGPLNQRPEKCPRRSSTTTSHHSAHCSLHLPPTSPITVLTSQYHGLRPGINGKL
jgi:hypothetical protein